ncbi:mitogen activated protein kinase, partial [Reticulomyxa filosa]
FEQRKPLFSSYRGNDTFTLSDRISQLDVIFRVIGTPSPEEIESSMILNENNKKYLRNLSPKFEPINWKSKFPDNDNEEALSLLNGKIHTNKQTNKLETQTALLQFDCEKRMTAREALQHSYFPTGNQRKKERKVRSHIYKSLQELESNWDQDTNTEANYRNRIADEILLFS